MCFLQRNVTEQVRTVKLADDLHQTKQYRGSILGKRVVLTLGFRQIEFDRVNCGNFMYWHKRLIKAYERVGRMLHSADYGRGVIGVIDITELMVRVPTFWAKICYRKRGITSFGAALSHCHISMLNVLTNCF